MNPREHTEKLAERINAFMSLHNITIAQMCRETKVTRETFYRILGDSKGIQFENGMRIEKYISRGINNN